MGCDIHAFIEYYHMPVDSTLSTHALTDEINFGRSYCLFSLLAGVRGSCDPVVKPRGLPNNPDISYETSCKYYLQVVDLPSISSSGLSIRHTITREAAEKLINSGRVDYANTAKTLIVDPAWHTPSWLTLNELMTVRQKYLIQAIEFDYEMSGKRRNDALDRLHKFSATELMQHVFRDVEHVQLNATIAAMMGIERSGHYKTRLVFWFDS